MTNKKHTIFKLWIKPVGEKSYKFEHQLRNKIFNSLDELEEWLEFGNPGNELIILHLDLSKFGMLENWKVLKTSFKSLSDCEFGAMNALKRMKDIQKQRLSKQKRNIKIGKKTVKGATISFTSKDYVISEFDFLKNNDNFWLDTQGKFHIVAAPGEIGLSHVEWASNWLKKFGDKFLKDDRSPSDILQSHKFGFVRIVGWAKEKQGFLFDCYKKPNYKQWNAIKDFCFIKEIKIPSWHPKFYFKS